MRAFTAVLALGSATSAFAALSLTVPASINQCQDATFQVSGNNGAVMLSVVPSVDPCQHDALLELGPFNPADGPITWHNVNIAAGTPVYVIVDDTANEEAWSQLITIGGDSSHCNSSSSGDNSATPTTTNGNTAATGTGAASRATNGNNGNAPVNAGSSTGTTSGAISTSPQIGITALLAGAAVAFFV